MKIGGVIRKLRIRAGYKQKDFAEACSLSPSFLSQIESNKRYPHPNTLKVISEVLGIPQEVLHMLSLEEEDIPAVIPKEKREAFNMLYSPFRDFMFQLFVGDKSPR